MTEERKNHLRTTTRRTGLTGLLLALLLGAGCFDDPTMGHVDGTITIDGQPPESGSIAFFPIDGNSSTTGAMIEAGKYSAEVPFGQVKVEIRVAKVIGQKKLYDTADSPVQPIMQEILPAKYNDQSELVFEVVRGKNRKDFSLSTE